MADKYSAANYQTLRAIYTTQRAAYLAKKSFTDSAVEWLSGDSRLKLVDDDVAKADAKMATTGGPPDIRGAIVLLLASLDTLGYVTTLPTYDDEVRAEVAADVKAIEDAAKNAVPYVKYGLMAAGAVILVVIVVAVSKGAAKVIPASA